MSKYLNIQEMTVGIFVVCVLACALVPTCLRSHRRATAPTKFSEPFVLDAVEHLPGSAGGWGSNTIPPKTVLTDQDGATRVVIGHIDTPPVGSRIHIASNPRAAPWIEAAEGAKQCLTENE